MSGLTSSDDIDRRVLYKDIQHSPEEGKVSVSVLRKVQRQTSRRIK